MSVTFAGGISFLIAIIILGFIYYDVSKDYGQAARDMWCLVNRWLSARFDLLSAVTIGVTGCIAVSTPTISAALAGSVLSFSGGMTFTLLFLEDSFDERFVIIEPVDIIRSRNHSERPLRTIGDIPPSSMYASTSSTHISDLPTRLSGWLSHTFTDSSTDLLLPSILSQSNFTSQASPKTKSSALLTAAKHGKGHLNRAMRFLLDSDSIPNKSSEPIWLLGVQHTGNEPPPHPTPSRRPSIESHRSPSFRSTISSSATVLPDLSLTLSSSSSKNPANSWPPVFYADFTS
ncbi:hypothetical protein C8R48DRAFT_772614 [Suillus tomentosus]|nr:hypothetical protein C8R48DRAFT_772614 [Suillus tomentosus]